MDLVKSDFNEVITILQEREKCKVVSEKVKDKIVFSSEDNAELDLCIGIYENKLVIRRVSFKNKHTGTLKILFQWFIEYCRGKELKYIVLQSIISEDMITFAVSNNFEPIPGKCVKDGALVWGDYEFALYNQIIE